MRHYGHVQEFDEANRGSHRCVGYVLCFDQYQVVCAYEVDLRENVCVMERVYTCLAQWHGSVSGSLCKGTNHLRLFSAPCGEGLEL